MMGRALKAVEIRGGFVEIAAPFENGSAVDGVRYLRLREREKGLGMQLRFTPADIERIVELLRDAEG